MVRPHVSGMIMNYVLFKYFTVKYSIILLFVSSQIIKFWPSYLKLKKTGQCTLASKDNPLIRFTFVKTGVTFKIMFL